MCGPADDHRMLNHGRDHQRAPAGSPGASSACRASSELGDEMD